MYFYPPEPLSAASPPIALMHQPGGVLNVTRAAPNTTLRNLRVVNGRHSGILAEGAVGLTIDTVAVHAHGSHGIVLTGATGGAILGSEVYDVGCSGIRATAGAAATLTVGGMVCDSNHVHHVANWKRSYMPGVYWGGVRKTSAADSSASACALPLVVNSVMSLGCAGWEYLQEQHRGVPPARVLRWRRRLRGRRRQSV